MAMKKRIFLFFICILLSCAPGPTALKDINQPKKTAHPPLGWNSYDCWFTSINETAILQNIDAFEKKLKPAGYEYFVLDDGWSYSGDIAAGAQGVYIDSFGRWLPDPAKFPGGLQPYIDLAHSKGMKFGVWLIRGAPLKTISQNMKIYGTDIAFSQVLDTSNKIDPFLGQASWHGTCAFGGSNAGMQEYYNSEFELLAKWQIDFVKYDYMTGSGPDMAAVTAARDRCGREMVISFSPSAGTNLQLYSVYEKADMVRIIEDVWDNRASLEKAYSSWELWQPYAHPGFWLDLDMIPFGTFPLYQRTDSFSVAQKKTFMAQRALAASPLIMGGSLPESDSISIALITDKDMLECNQNGICGRLLYRTAQYDVWGTISSSDPTMGWVGVFNRNQIPVAVNLGIPEFGLDTNSTYQLYDIWEKKLLMQIPYSCTIESDGVIFIRYRRI
jgi:hypothetical protein